jgi:hypothetical protein
MKNEIKNGRIVMKSIIAVFVICSLLEHSDFLDRSTLRACYGVCYYISKNVMDYTRAGYLQHQIADIHEQNFRRNATGNNFLI